MRDEPSWWSQQRASLRGRLRCVPSPLCCREAFFFLSLYWKAFYGYLTYTHGFFFFFFFLGFRGPHLIPKRPKTRTCISSRIELLSQKREKREKQKPRRHYGRLSKGRRNTIFGSSKSFCYFSVLDLLLYLSLSHTHFNILSVCFVENLVSSLLLEINTKKKIE